MPRPDGRIEPGQPLRGAISARAWNRAQDAADIVLGAYAGTEGGVPGSPVLTPYTWCYGGLFSGLGGFIPAYYPVAITGMQIVPTSDINDSATTSFRTMPVLTLGKVQSNYEGAQTEPTTLSWGVSVEPIVGGGVHKVAVAGVVPCRIDIINDKHTCVQPFSTGSRNVLRSAMIGGGQIVWKESGTGQDKWALIRIGAPETTVLLGTFTGSWSRTDRKTVTEVRSGQQYTNVINHFGNISAAVGRPKKCAIAWTTSDNERLQFEWTLIAAEC